MLHNTVRRIDYDREFMIGPNESTYIQAGHKHRLSNPGVKEVVLIEVQIGKYLGEDDIERFDDKYGVPVGVLTLDKYEEYVGH